MTTSKKVKSKEFVEDDFSSSSDDDQEKAKQSSKKNKKQKPPKKEGVKGFTDNEIRRYLMCFNVCKIIFPVSSFSLWLFLILILFNSLLT